MLRDTSDRLLYIDNLKGLAIILVVMGHVSYISFGIENTIFNASYISFHMPLFMFLSGIFAYHSFHNYNTKEAILFIKKKFFRIIIPFASVGIVYSLIDIGNIYGHFLGTPGRLWFLPALFLNMLVGLAWLYLSNYIKKMPTPKFSNKRRTVLYGGIEIGLALFFFFVLCVAYYKGISFPYFLHAIKMFPFFMFGVFYNKYLAVNEMVSKSNFFYSLSIILFLFFFLMQFYNIITDWFLFAGFFAIVILIQLFKNNEEKTPRWLSVCGRYSMEIYLFHFLFLPKLTIVDHLSFLLLNDNFTLLFAATSIISIPVVIFSIYLSKIIHKSKALDVVVFGNYRLDN